MELKKVNLAYTSVVGRKKKLGRPSLANRKGQAWGFDLVAALIIFLAGIIFLYFYTINYPNSAEEAFQELQREGELVADSLLSEGSPADWNENNVVKIGLLSDNEINNTKLSFFYNLNYNLTKNLFRINNDYYVRFQEPIFIEGTNVPGIGLPAVGEKNIAKITRVVIYNDTIKSFNIYVWN